tara:strand:+ start:268 stop:540 length:273 start_codon:yes stop_codon:yes gene_type:complete
MDNTRGMWDEPIAELKIGGINGISFRKGKIFGKRKPMVEVEIVITDIKRELDDVDDEIFLIYRTDDKGNPRLLKAWKGKDYYVTFDINED